MFFWFAAQHKVSSSISSPLEMTNYRQMKIVAYNARLCQFSEHNGASNSHVFLQRRTRDMVGTRRDVVLCQKYLYRQGRSKLPLCYRNLLLHDFEGYTCVLVVYFEVHACKAHHFLGATYSIPFAFT